VSTRIRNSKRPWTKTYKPQHATPHISITPYSLAVVLGIEKLVPES
jgi:hypothetical protein